MREISMAEAAEDFAGLIAQVERGETVLIRKGGRTVAKVEPVPTDLRDDPAWRAAREGLLADLRGREDDGYRVGKITEEDKYGPSGLSPRSSYPP